MKEDNDNKKTEEELLRDEKEFRLTREQLEENKAWAKRYIARKEDPQAPDPGSLPPYVISCMRSIFQEVIDRRMNKDGISKEEFEDLMKERG